MEVCNLDECDFVETRIKEYEKEDFYIDNDSIFCLQKRYVKLQLWK